MTSGTAARTAGSTAYILVWADGRLASGPKSSRHGQPSCFDLAPVDKRPRLGRGRLASMMMLVLGHFFERVLGPRGDGVDVAVLIAHELQVAQRNRDRLGADAEEAADIDDGLAADAVAVDMIDFADLVVVGAVDGGTLQDGRGQLVGGEANVIGVIHCIVSALVLSPTNPGKRQPFHGPSGLFVMVGGETVHLATCHFVADGG